jgi:hypothetical protein
VRRCPNPFLAEHDLVTAFEAGWRLLYEDVSPRACDRLIATLADVRHLDFEIARDRDRLRRTLVRHRSSGAPWRAQEAIAILDTPAWAGLCVCSANARYCGRSCRRCSPAARAR